MTIEGQSGYFFHLANGARTSARCTDGHSALADSKEIFARALKHWLEARNVSGTRLAAALNKNRGAVSKWLTGAAGPDLDTIFKIAEILEIPVYLLFMAPGKTPEMPHVPSESEDQRVMRYLAERLGMKIRIRS